LRPQAAPHRTEWTLRSRTPPDHRQPNDHPAWSPPPGPGPWPGTTPATCPGRPTGAGEHLLGPMLPATRPAPWPWTSAPVGPPGPRRRRSRDAGQAAALATVDPPASRHRQPPRHRFPCGPMPAGDHAAHRPRGHVDPLRPAGAARHAEPLQVQRGADTRGGSAADTRGVSVRTPGCTGHLEHRTPGRWRSARPGKPPIGRDAADRSPTMAVPTSARCRSDRPASIRPQTTPDATGSARAQRTALIVGQAARCRPGANLDGYPGADVQLAWCRALTSEENVSWSRC
jgi:hypothetical protein